LDFEASQPLELGECKIPSSLDDSGGLSFGVVPGHPQCSILPFRMEITGTSGMMPPLGRNLVDPAGLELVRDWIRAMPENLCGQTEASCLQP
jgi:hypothetical protein